MQSTDQSTRRANAHDVQWRVTTPTGRTLVCTVNVAGGEVEVRLTASDAVVWADRVPSLDAATALTRRWLHVVLSAEHEPPSTVIH